MKLYGGKDRIFPEFIMIDGERFAINADFRNILRIFAMMKDGNISDMKKIYKLHEWFLNSDKKPLEASKIIQAFGAFINADKIINQGQNGVNSDIPEEQQERQFCYDFDGGEIYASFLSEYKIDLIACEFLHWYQFKIMLLHLPESSAFKKKVALRFIDLSKFSREESIFSIILQAWESVQLPCEHHKYNEYNDEEMREALAFKEFWERV